MNINNDCDEYGHVYKDGEEEVDLKDRERDRCRRVL
jgi:hypothetical protein